MPGFVCPMTLYYAGKEGSRWTGFHGNALMRARSLQLWSLLHASPLLLSCSRVASMNVFPQRGSTRALRHITGAETIATVLRIITRVSGPLPSWPHRNIPGKTHARPLHAVLKSLTLREFCLSQADQAARRACSSRCRPGILCLLAVGNESGDQMNHKIDGTAMARMLDLRTILELVNNGLDNRSFARALVCPKDA